MSFLDGLFEGHGPAEQIATSVEGVPGVPVDVEAPPPAAGQVLTAVSPTRAVWAPGGDAGLAEHIGSGGDAHALVTDTEAGFISPASQAKLDSLPFFEEWPPRGSHPDNEEWESTVNALPTGWGIYLPPSRSMIWDSIETLEPAIGSPTFGNVDPDLIVASDGANGAGGIRIDINSARRSHIYWQESQGEQPGWGPAMGRFALLKKLSVPVGAEASFLIHWGEAPIMSAAMLEMGGSQQFILCGEVDGKPSLTGKVIISFARVGPGGGSRYAFRSHVTGIGSYPQLYSGQPSERYLVSMYPYAMLIKRVDKWWLRLYGADGSMRNLEMIINLGGGSWAPSWWGICCPNKNTGASPGALAGSPYMSCNFLRRWDHAVKVL